MLQFPWSTGGHEWWHRIRQIPGAHLPSQLPNYLSSTTLYPLPQQNLNGGNETLYSPTNGPAALSRCTLCSIITSHFLRNINSIHISKETSFPFEMVCRYIPSNEGLSSSPVSSQMIDAQIFEQEFSALLRVLLDKPGQGISRYPLAKIRKSNNSSWIKSLALANRHFPRCPCWSRRIIIRHHRQRPFDSCCIRRYQTLQIQ